MSTFWWVLLAVGISFAVAFAFLCLWAYVVSEAIGAGIAKGRADCEGDSRG